MAVSDIIESAQAERCRRADIRRRQHHVRRRLPPSTSPTSQVLLHRNSDVPHLVIHVDIECLDRGRKTGYGECVSAWTVVSMTRRAS